MQVIVFDNGNGVSVLHPTADANLDQVEARVVPAEAARIRIEASNLPDRATRDRWRLSGGVIEIGPEDLGQRRAAAILEKGAFCSMLKPTRANILSVSEAVQAARGDWPATFAAFTASLPEDVAADAQIKWAAATEIHYADPLLQALALHWANGDQAAATAVLDQIFGIAP
jgi:hypothetical protein